MTGNCRECRFAERLEEAMRCRRCAPRPGQERNEWPIVWHDDWCGEFESKSDKNASEA